MDITWYPNPPDHSADWCALPLEEEEDLFEVTLMPATGTEPAMEMTPEATPETTTGPDTEESPEQASEELELRGED